MCRRSCTRPTLLAVLEHLLTTGRLAILADDIESPNLVRIVEEVVGIPMLNRLKNPKDLGGILVIAHSLQLQEDGSSVTVLIDDKDGARKAKDKGLRCGYN